MFSLPLSAAQLTISWQDNSSNESGFEVERALGSGSFTRVATLAANTTQYRDTSVTTGTTYRYRVRAFNSSGKSAYSNIGSAAARASSKIRKTTAALVPGDIGSLVSGDIGSLVSGDIGSPTLSGSTTINGTRYRIRAGGSDIWNARDEFRFVRQTLEGDAEITVRVSSLTRAHPWSKAGIMFRSSLNDAAAHVSVLVTPDNGVSLLWRRQNGGLSSSEKVAGLKAPAWLRLLRDGDTFYAFHSANGTKWDLVDFVKVILPTSVPAGLVVTSHNPRATSTAVFDQLTIDTTTEYLDTSVTQGTTNSNRVRADNSSEEPAYSNIGSAAPQAASTEGTMTTALVSGDIGSPTLSGSTTINGTRYQIRAGGSDIWNARDEFRFARQTVVGDAEITVRVSSLTRAHPWSKAGIMFRSSLDDAAAHVSVLVTPDNGVSLLWRRQNGGLSSSEKVAGLKAPVWLRLLRDGDTFYAFHSANGTKWDLVDFVKVILPTSVPAGLVVTSHNPRAISTAVFEQLTID